MTKKTFLFVISFTFFIQANCQITRGNWLVGGSASFLYNNSKTGIETKEATLDLAPDIGYFFINKFAGGIRLSFYNDHIQIAGNSTLTIFRDYSIGPFARYYFLPIDNPYNIVSEISSPI